MFTSFLDELLHSENRVDGAAQTAEPVLELMVECCAFLDRLQAGEEDYAQDLVANL